MEENKNTWQILSSNYKHFFQKIGWEFILFAIIIGLYYDSLIQNYSLVFSIPCDPQYFRCYTSNFFLYFIIIIGIFFMSGSFFYVWAHSKSYNKLKYIILILFFSLQIPFVINLMQLQHSNKPNTLFSNDGAIQTNLAMNFILAGKNPYQETYLQGIMGTDRKYTRIGWISLKHYYEIPNPALDSYAYMPLNFLLPIPVKILFETMWQFYDQRIFLDLCYLIVILIAYKLSSDKKNKFVFLIVMLFNPLLLEGLWYGFNDVFGLMFILLAVLMLKKQRFKTSIMAVTLAALCKQNFIFYWPFFLLYIYLKKINKLKDIWKLWPYLAIMLGLSLGIILPFIFWYPGSFYHDTVYYIGNIYPARGIGFSGLLLALHVLKSPFDKFNFLAWQIASAVLILPWLIKLQTKNNTPAKVYLYGTILMSIVWFFSRYFHEAHFNFVVTSFLIAAFL